MARGFRRKAKLSLQQANDALVKSQVLLINTIEPYFERFPEFKQAVDVYMHMTSQAGDIILMLDKKI